MQRQVTVVWGQRGIESVADAATFVIVDVLSFSSAVDAACSRGATVYPFAWKDDRATDFAKQKGALLAQQRQDAVNLSDSREPVPTLSPPSLLTLSVGSKLVLPSPNGSTLSVHTGAVPTIAACLRNAKAVASYLNRQPIMGTVVIVAAGERWADGSLRPALEDLVGAGALVDALGGQPEALTPDAKAARAVFREVRETLSRTLLACPSGVELTSLGFREDVTFAAELNVSTTVPCQQDGAYVAVPSGEGR